MMIRSIIFIMLALFLNSCTSQSGLIESNSPDQKIEFVRLAQHVRSGPANQKNGAQRYGLIASYNYKIDERNKSLVSLEWADKKPSKADVPDSVIVLILDGENFRITSVAVRNNDNTVLSSSQFLIPESLWISIVYTETIQYRVYIENEEYEIFLNGSKTKKLKSFFEKALEKRDASLPPLPESKKKW